MFDPGLGVIHKYSGIDATEPTLPLEEERKVLAVGLRLDVQETAQTLLVEEARVKCISGAQTSNRIASVLRRPPQFKHRAAGGCLSTLAHEMSV
jgi:hypothetical protein